MVRTRSRANGILFAHLSQEQRYQLEELARGASQPASQSSQSSQSTHGSQHHSFEYDYFDHMENHQEPDRRQTSTSYKESDNCHRHALPDERSKSIQVTTYRRRKPR